MNFLFTKQALASQIMAISLVCTGLGLANTATAAPFNNTSNPSLISQNLNYGLLNFSASASKKVDNDQVNATMTKTVQSRSSAEVASQITMTLNQAIQIAKKYPQVKVTTGNQATYPQYDKNQKITGWTGNASLYLKSTDTVATSKLIAELQSTMTLNGLDFSVSDDLRKKVEQTLMVEASQNFQRQAQALLPTWNARDYQLVNLEFNQGGDYHSPRAYGGMMMLAKADSVPQQDMQAGESTITVTANGVVQLVK